MASTTQHARPRWLVLLRPRWLAWHAFAVVAALGMLWLGRWQLHRAESGNELSWAYTVEWPLFAVAGVYFWIKTLREELRTASARTAGAGREQASPAADERPEAADQGSAAGEQPAAADAYRARLLTEVQRHGKWHGWR